MHMFRFQLACYESIYFTKTCQCWFSGWWTDIDECTVLSNPCGQFAVCENAVPGYNCLCPQGYAAQPSPDIACEQVIDAHSSQSYGNDC